VVTKNPVADPVLEAASWRLILDGEVNRPVQVDFATLLQLPAVEQTKTLECISNFTTDCDLAAFGCDLISTAVWRGARVADVLALAGGLKSGAVSLRVLGADEFTSAVPARLALDPDAILAYAMNGESLPRRHGYPVRMLVPGRYGMKNAKWVVALRPVSRDFIDWYGQRNWNKEGIVKTMTRIDTPAPDATLPVGEHRLAGIAYAGSRGVARVEYSVDEGMTWLEASFIEPPVGNDVWVRWEAFFSIDGPEPVTLMSRAIDGEGVMQLEGFSLPQPDGGTGWHSITVQAQA
jgi:DMSO/TMAO reductase YedYZ molybdopterin-dependent catalytic subunit